MINRALKRAVAIIAGVLLALAATVVPAFAGENYGLVIDNRGASIAVDCNLTYKDGKPAPNTDHTLYQKSSGKKYMSSQFTGCSDADAFKLNYDSRCVEIVDNTNGGTSNTYKADPGHWFKIPGLHVAHGLPWSSCAPNDGWLGNHLLRLT